MEEKLLEDSSFQEAFSKTASAEEASALFAQHGIQITPEELQEIMTKMESESELNESELDDVAGGSMVAARVGLKIIGWWLKNHPNVWRSLIW